MTKPEDRLPRHRKLAFGSGLVAYSLMNNGYNIMLNPIFNVNFGISPVVLGWVTALSRFYDAFTDPTMGAISDNTRSRIGRRRPYLALGGFLGGIFFALLWWAPREASDTFYMLWVLLGSLLLYTAFTIYSVPYIALSFEMTPDYHERTRVMSYKVAMGMLGGLMVGSFFWLTQRPIFSDTIEGMRYVGIGAGIVVFLVSLIPTFFAREHPNAKRAASQQKQGIIKSMRSTLKQPAFLMIIALTVILLCSLSLVTNLGFYVNLYHVYDGDQPKSAGVHMVSMYANQLCALIAIPCVSWFSARHGKRRTLALFLMLALIGSVSTWFCYTPDAPYLQVIPKGLMGAGMGATWLLLNAMIPEVCDVDELNTGIRREGMYSAVYSWTFKMGLGLSLVGGGYILVFSGYDANLGVAQSEDALWWMRFLYMVVPVLGISTALIILRLYPIDEDAAYNIREQLEEKRKLAE